MRWWIEAKVAWAPTMVLVPLGLLLLALMHTGFGGGSSLWARHWAENCEAFLPIGFGLLSAPLLLVEVEEGTWEMTGALPMTHLGMVRIVAVVGGEWILALLGLLFLRIVFGPVPFLTGFLAALGPGLMLGGVSTLVAVATGRVAMGYLMAIGIPVADLVLKLLGAFTALWPLQLIDVFAYRWPVRPLGFGPVVVFMALLGVFLYVMAIGRWRFYTVRQF